MGQHYEHYDLCYTWVYMNVISTSNPSPSMRLLNDALRAPVEQLVSEYYGREWRVKTFKDLIDFASHHCAILSDGLLAVFVKLSEAANGLDHFEVELAGLRFLSEHAGVLTPSLIGNVLVEGGVIMVLGAVQVMERQSRQWRQIGQSLAQIHRVKGDRFGFDRQGYFGPFYQDNRPMEDWLAFYLERRLWPRFIGAIDSGNLPTQAIRQIEKLISRLPSLDIPSTPPALLHGDAQVNNFISTEQGAVVVDPAIYFGIPEIDLAYVDYFQPVPEDIFVGYQEVLPIEPGFRQRRELWCLPTDLAMVTVEGTIHLDKLTRVVQKYL
jgi:protein-ribulosamine 3-kinase